MSSENDPTYGKMYRVILIHYNEVGLKSPQYKDRLEKKLIEHIKQICKRERLTLQSLLHLQDRLLFFFPPDQIPRAITVFRYIIGVQSISPAIIADRDLDKIKEKLLTFAHLYLQSNDRFNLRFKSITAIGKRFEDIEKEWGLLIQENNKNNKKIVEYSPKKAKITFHIEMREKGAYIYSEKIPTVWGGFPTETDKAMFCEWIGEPMNPVAALMLLRRGSIILPVVFQFKHFHSNQIQNDTNNQLTNLAKYYSAKITIIKVNIAEILEKLRKYAEQSHLPCSLCVYSRYKIIDALLEYHGKEGPYRYNEAPLYPHGVIFAHTLQSLTFINYAREFRYLQLFPLVSFTPDALKHLSVAVNTPVEFWNISDKKKNGYTMPISLIDTTTKYIIQNSQNNKKDESKKDSNSFSACSLSNNCEFFKTYSQSTSNTYLSIEDLNSIFTDKEISSKIQQIISEQEINEISGQILPDEIHKQLTIADLDRILPPQVLDNLPSLIQYLGEDRIIQALSLDKIIQVIGKEKIQEYLEKTEKHN